MIGFIQFTRNQKRSIGYSYTQNEKEEYLKNSDTDGGSREQFKTCSLVYNDKSCFIRLWRFHNLRYGRSNYALYRGAHCVFIIFDCTDFQSFQNVRGYYQECQRYAKEDITIFIIACKIDDTENRVVTQLDAIDLAKELGDLPYFEVNCKNPSPFEKQTFDTIFQTAAKIIIGQYDNYNSLGTKTTTPPVVKQNKSILKFWK